MGLITKTVKIKVRGLCDIKRYEDLGYVIPKKNSTSNAAKLVYALDDLVDIKVEDLPKNSHAPVEYTCDECGKNVSTSYSDYLKFRRDDGSSYCRKCGQRINIDKQLLQSYYNNKSNNSNTYSNNSTTYANQGIYRNEEAKKLIEEMRKNKTSERCSKAYLHFVDEVLRRDNYTCQKCGTMAFNNSKVMEVHHMNAFAWAIDERTDPNNGITLCKECHIDYHRHEKQTGTGTRELFEKWLGRPVEQKDNYTFVQPRNEIICLDDGNVFDCLAQAEDYYGIPALEIGRCCRKEFKHTHSLHFLYLKDYEQMSKNDIEEFFKTAKENKSNQRILCMNTGKIYEKIVDVCADLGMDRQCVRRSCKNRKANSKYKDDNGKFYSFRYLNDNNQIVDINGDVVNEKYIFPPNP